MTDKSYFFPMLYECLQSRLPKVLCDITLYAANTVAGHFPAREYLLNVATIKSVRLVFNFIVDSTKGSCTATSDTS